MPNRLAHETSPYLQQHATNPVEWYPWSEEALGLALAQDKPILLSVGYSACHWCHVMAHESFEDSEVAAEMNRHFVNIKVDREERPDLDQIYQTAHQLLTQRSGGWPLTVFLTPNGTPFFAGTYFPKTARHGMPGFKELLGRVAEAYHSQREQIAQQSVQLSEALKRTMPTAKPERPLDARPLDSLIRELAQLFDDVHGGIGDGPKFPHSFELAFCLRRHAVTGGALSDLIARFSLSHMARGGIFDQLGGGFYRYSVDRIWGIPHFEKMLYDNGPLLALYADAWLATREPLFENIAMRTAAWVVRDMQSAEGGYYSSLDADSEGEEGKFYVWRREEIQSLLTSAQYDVFARHFGLAGPPNFENRYWHLHIEEPLDVLANELGLSLQECMSRVESARATLLEVREKRVKPARDEKVLTSWNALMIKGMARAGRIFGQREWIDSARRATTFLHQRLWTDGRLLATYKDGKAHLNAYLDDHAFLLDALLELIQTEFRMDDVVWAQAIADTLLAQFEDSREGGFFFTSHDHERLIYRPKTGHDNATPSGNGIAAFALQRLGYLLGETRYIESAQRTIRLFQPQTERSASAHVSLTCALEEALSPPRVVVLRGERHELSEWQSELGRTFRPDTLVVAIAEDVRALAASLDKHARSTESPRAWICEGTRCLSPVSDLAQLKRDLDARTGAAP
jgi:uncharacterized protein YyaL (SSP411 family)